MFRSARVWAAAALVLTVAGCSGPADLGKSVSNRRVVKAQGTFTSEGLRTVDPCALYTDDLVNAVGKKKPSGVPDLDDYSECSYDVYDPAGKNMRLLIRVGKDLFSAPKQTGKTLAGLGVFETRTSSGCDMTAITNREPDIGVVTRATTETGDPCAVATKVLENAIQQISQGKAKYPDTPDSLVKQDPCAAIDDQTLSSVLGAGAEKQLNDIRRCDYATKPATISVKYTIDRDPANTLKSYNPTTVELSDKVKTAYQFKTSGSPAKCQVEWLHRALSGNYTENVNVSFNPADAKSAIDTCPFTVAAAKAVAARLARR